MPSVVWNETSLAFAGVTHVYVRQYWSDAWSEIVNMHATEVRWTLYPEIPSANLAFFYGPYLPSNGTSFSTVSRTNWLGYYVKIVVECEDGNLLWVGFIDSQTDTQGGIVGGIASGKLDLVAYGMAAVLQYERVINSRWWDGTAVRTSGSGLTFNKQSTNSDEPGKNRTATIPSGTGSHAFSAETTAVEWTAQDIVTYLLKYHSPTHPDGSPSIPFTATNSTLLPDWNIGEIATDGYTVWELLERLIDKRNFLTASYLYDEGTNTNVLQFHSMSHINASLGAGKTLLANSSLLTIACHADNATTAIVQATATQNYQRVLVRGARRTTICTLRANNDGLDKAWTTGEKDAFNAGASAESTYAALQDTEKRLANERIRETLQHVFRRFKLYSDDWSLTSQGQVFRADDDATRHYAFPHELKILPEVPWHPNGDYDGNKLATNHADAIKNSGLWAKPFIVIHRYEVFGDFIPLDALPDFHVEVRMFDDRNIEFVTQGVSQMHLATGVAVPTAVDIVERRQYDYTYIQATLAIQEDRYAEATNASFASVNPLIDQVRTILVYTPGSERLDRAQNGAIVGITADANYDKVTIANGTPTQFVNDGRDRLRWLAELYALWYGVARSVLTINSARPSATPFVGQMVTTLNAGTAQAATINSIISEITLSLPLVENGIATPPSYTLRTTAYELTELPV